MSDFDLNSLKLEKLTIDDLDELADLEKEIFPNPWSKESLKFELAHRSNSVSYKLIYNNRMIAYCFSWKGINEYHIGNFAVIEDFRRKGIGSYLLKLIIEKGRELGANFFYLEVRKSNKPAINLYEKFGFKVIGTKEAYYSDNKEDAIVMALIV
ncbi:ribosomal protein S18-alanine N-acetyltransferase [candidate division KSB1 bacterium]